MLDIHKDPRPRSFYETRKDCVQWKNCPTCTGRGWFLINPFATGGANGAGGLGNMRQCKHCEFALKFYEEHDKEPTAKDLEGVES